LILGFLFAASHHGAVVQRPLPPVLVPVRYDPDDRDRERADDREEVEGLPVPIVPGTRVDEARIQPPQRIEADERSAEQGAERLPSPIRSIAGRLSATVERARDDARLQLERDVTEWLTPEVPTHWKPPAPLITRMILKTDVQPIVKNYGGRTYTIYEATLDANFSTETRSELLAAYHREVVARRLAILGGSLGFVLVCLAAVAGYIRADEATKGYYTPWLRAIAAAGVGASGVLIYQLLA
jgi:hypothetical protein